MVEHRPTETKVGHVASPRDILAFSFGKYDCRTGRRARGRKSRPVERTRAAQHEDSWLRRRKPSKFDAAELRAALHCTLRILRLAERRGRYLAMLPSLAEVFPSPGDRWHRALGLPPDQRPFSLFFGQSGNSSVAFEGCFRTWSSSSQPLQLPFFYEFTTIGRLHCGEDTCSASVSTSAVQRSKV